MEISDPHIEWKSYFMKFAFDCFICGILHFIICTQRDVGVQCPVPQNGFHRGYCLLGVQKILDPLELGYAEHPIKVT